MGKKTRRQRKTFYLLLVAALAIGCVVAIHYENYWRAVWTGSFAIATACWIIAVLYPVSCAVTTRQGLPCRNTANGVLFGCSRHTWIKFWAHFGRHERLQVRTTASRAERPAPEPAHANVLFWLTIVATCSGFISMTTDVAGLFD
ncbi:hypothetical protein SK854_01605 [Lentzea sp. BCCO 10_0061]|uniref:Uncharacterized protein n=1 Tax=Lentzea sokolovensis TaxID=3095429 RepID=A0ABU4UMR9_9PSEU|nr:hypothetical protein [Lentzea sp. BCCO 10_0061]MDX8140788.1 hypothetical protein [Lentzea sp. BCCO 10_0061]